MLKSLNLYGKKGGTEMRRKIFSSIAVALILSLSLCANAGAVATADCELRVDWSSLQISGGDYGVGWNYIGLNSETWINGPETTNPGYEHSQSPWQSTPLVWSLGNNTANLSSDQTLISHTSSSARGDGDVSGWINGNNHRGMSLALIPNTTYTFSVDYSIDVNMSRQNADQENANNYAQVALWLTEAYPGSSRIKTEVAPFSSNFTAGSLDYAFTFVGTIELIVSTLVTGTPYTTDKENDLFGYDRYWFETHMHTSTSTSSTFISEAEPSPVPEPSTMLLLSSGLAGLAGVRKRLRKS
jgi:hypothetical protein